MPSSVRSYKELMAKCNALGRGEARSLKKLEKAKEKITKLKVLQCSIMLFVTLVQSVKHCLCLMLCSLLDESSGTRNSY